MQIFEDVGPFDNSHQFATNSWEELLLKSLMNVTGTPLRSTDPASARVRSAISDLMDPNAEFARRAPPKINLLREADALSGASVHPIPFSLRPGPHQQTVIEHFAQLLSAELEYNADERDMVVLSHEIVSRPKHLGLSLLLDEMVYTSSLMVTGTPSTGQRAMSRTVGLPLAFATQEVLDGCVDGCWVLGGKEVWQAVLGGMASVGIHMWESFSSLSNERTLTVEGQLLPRSCCPDAASCK